MSTVQWMLVQVENKIFVTSNRACIVRFLIIVAAWGLRDCWTLNLQRFVCSSTWGQWPGCSASPGSWCWAGPGAFIPTLASLSLWCHTAQHNNNNIINIFIARIIIMTAINQSAMITAAGCPPAWPAASWSRCLPPRWGRAGTRRGSALLPPAGDWGHFYSDVKCCQ